MRSEEDGFLFLITVIICLLQVVQFLLIGDGMEVELVIGTPETVAEHPTSHTGRYLKQVLQQHPPEVLAG